MVMGHDLLISVALSVIGGVLCNEFHTFYSSLSDYDKWGMKWSPFLQKKGK